MTRDELLRAWVIALESGEYRQARKTLRTKDGFCCLGVACDVSGLGEWRRMPEVVAASLSDYDTERPYEPECEESTHLYRADQTQGDEIDLPDILLDHIGLTREQQNRLQNMNDGGVTFANIAQQIREWFPDVFTEVV